MEENEFAAVLLVEVDEVRFLLEVGEDITVDSTLIFVKAILSL